MRKVLSVLLLVALSAALVAGCGNTQQGTPVAETAQVPETQPQADSEVLTGGVLCIKVNPEIALHYDANGNVTKLEGRNPEGQQILAGISEYEGQDMMLVLENLVAAIGDAGYFVEEVDGAAQQIVLELDPGSQVPYDQFLQNVAVHVKACVERRCWVRAEQTDSEVAAETEAETWCPICYDNDCDDGEYCDDYDDRGENLQERVRKRDGTACGVCGEYDCDDGIWCDDWDECQENGRHKRGHE